MASAPDSSGAEAIFIGTLVLKLLSGHMPGRELHAMVLRGRGTASRSSGRSGLDELVRSGAVGDDTLVWREGMANWQPHGTARGVRPPPRMPDVPVGAPTSFCSECGRPFASSQLVAMGNASVCAQCKPIYLQRMREGGQAIGTRRYAGFWIRFVAAASLIS